MDHNENCSVTEFLRETRKLHTMLLNSAKNIDRCVADCRSVWDSESAELLFRLYDEECAGNALLKHTADAFCEQQDSGTTGQALFLPNSIL